MTCEPSEEGTEVLKNGIVAGAVGDQLVCLYHMCVNLLCTTESIKSNR